MLITKMSCIFRNHSLQGFFLVNNVSCIYHVFFKCKTKEVFHLFLYFKQYFAYILFKYHHSITFLLLLRKPIFQQFFHRAQLPCIGNGKPGSESTPGGGCVHFPETGQQPRRFQKLAVPRQSTQGPGVPSLYRTERPA